MIDTGDSFILSGSCSLPVPAEESEWPVWIGGPGLVLIDATGHEIPYHFARDIDRPMPANMYSRTWAVEIGKNFVAPLTISCQATHVSIDSQASYAFDFDTGPNPQVGQILVLNKEIQMAGHAFTLVVNVQQGHESDESSYLFMFSSKDGSVIGVNVDIEEAVPQSSENGRQTASHFYTKLNFTELPTGQLHIILSDLQVLGETETWSLNWTPD